MNGWHLSKMAVGGCANIVANAMKLASHDQLMELMKDVPIPLVLSLFLSYRIGTGRARLALSRLTSKVGMKACVECVVRSKDERYNAIRSHDVIDRLMSVTDDGPDPSGWVTLLIAHGCKAMPKSKARSRVREIDVITILVSRSVVSRLHPKLWLPRDLWRSFVEFYVAPWTVSNDMETSEDEDEEENSDDE